MPIKYLLDSINNNAIVEITVPKEATNGDIIKALFPNAKIGLLKSETDRTKVAVEWGFELLPSYYNLFYEEWWGAPYKKGEN